MFLVSVAFGRAQAAQGQAACGLARGRFTATLN
jgi:hypothetical protein